MRAPRKALFIALILLVAFLQSPLAIIPYAQCAEGDYLGSWDTSGQTGNPPGIAAYGGFIWIVDPTADEVFKYYVNGTYTTEHWDTNSEGNNPQGITTDGNFIWTLDFWNDEVYKYSMTGVYTTDHFDTSGQSTGPGGITTDGEFIWVLDYSIDEVFKYHMNGTYTTEHWDTTGEGAYPVGITTDGINIWIYQVAFDEVYKYSMAGVYTTEHWDTSGEFDNGAEMATDGVNFYIVDIFADEVWIYEGPSPPSGLEDKGIVASDSTVNDGQWFFLNSSIEILPDTSTFLFNRIDIDPDGLNMSCSYTNGTGFSEENDPNNYLQLDIAVSVKTDLNNTFVRVDYYLRLHHNVTKDGLYNVTVYSTASGDLSDSDNYTSVFTLTIRTPSAPTLLFGAGFNASSPYVELHWTHDLLIFNIFEVQNSSNDADWSYLGQNTTAQYTDSQVVNGTERYYKVRACRSWGGGWKNSSFTDSNFETVHFIISVGGVNGDGDVNIPAVLVITFNTTIAEEGCAVYGAFSDVEGLSGYIFWNNATSAPGGVNSSFTALAGNSDSALENITLPSNGTRIGVRYYVNDTHGNWGVDTLAMFPAAEAGDTYVTGSVGIFLIVLIIIIPIVFYAVKKR